MMNDEYRLGRGSTSWNIREPERQEESFDRKELVGYLYGIAASSPFILYTEMVQNYNIKIVTIILIS
jgi:hypothetical protein